MKNEMATLENKIGVRFRNKELLRRALTHSSYAYEHQQKGKKVVDNEVLEFLGDSVVGLAMADFFCASFPDLAEGDLSKYKATAASSVTLSQFARQLKLDKFLFLGKGEEHSGGRTKGNILADAFEALVGAIYLDQGYEAAKRFLLPYLKRSYQKTGGHVVDNYKSALQEYFQKENLPAPHYKTVTSVGPDHEQTFIVEVCLGPFPLAKAKGPSKKVAEQGAAQKALRSLMGKKMKILTGETFMVKK
jgi:ribonuclease-3